MSKPQVEDITYVSTTSKPKKARLRHTNIFFTVNTNKRFSEHSEEYEDIKPKFKEVIDKVKIVKAEELAPKTLCLHMHGAIYIAHRSYIRIDTDKLALKFKKEINI